MKARKVWNEGLVLQANSSFILMFVCFFVCLLLLLVLCLPHLSCLLSFFDLQRSHSEPSDEAGVYTNYYHYYDIYEGNAISAFVWLNEI